MMSIDNPVAEMTLDECWELLRDHEFGRLAYRVVDEVHLVPINYVAAGGSGTDTLLMRTAPGNKLFAAALGSDVAFEIDWHDTERAWSVVVRGSLRRLEEDEQPRLDGDPHEPWVPTRKDEVVELVPVAVTGRRFGLRPGVTEED